LYIPFNLLLFLSYNIVCGMHETTLRCGSSNLFPLFSYTSIPENSSLSFLNVPSNFFPFLSNTSTGLSSTSCLYVPANFFLFLSYNSILGGFVPAFLILPFFLLPFLSKTFGFPNFLPAPLFLSPPFSHGPTLFFNFPGIGLSPSPGLPLPSNGFFNFPGIRLSLSPGLPCPSNGFFNLPGKGFSCFAFPVSSGLSFNLPGNGLCFSFPYSSGFSGFILL